jgi:hypothetical protein
MMQTAAKGRGRVPARLRRSFDGRAAHRRPNLSRCDSVKDLVAEVLTGNRRHFWLKPHSTPGSSKPVGPQSYSFDAEWERKKAERDKERSGSGD